MTNAGAEWLSQYATLRAGAAWFDLHGWSQLELQGADRAKFLHNLCSNDIKGLAPGAGCEAFLLNVQGKILFHVLVFSGPDALVLFTAPGHAERLLAHLDRYLIREQVILHDRTSEWASLLIAGPRASEVAAHCAAVAVPTALYGSVETLVAGRPTWLRRVEITSTGDVLVSCRAEDFDEVSQAVAAHGASVGSEAIFDVARIETGFPRYGQDITEKNLPQEVGRDERAIHFNKGCYLGQETVARIDALGHVNWKLCVLQFTGTQIPAINLDLLYADKAVGHVTSAVYSPRLEAPIALAYLRREQSSPGTQLKSLAGPVEVIRLPIG